MGMWLLVSVGRMHVTLKGPGGILDVGKCWQVLVTVSSGIFCRISEVAGGMGTWEVSLKGPLWEIRWQWYYIA